MRKVKVFFKNVYSGILVEIKANNKYMFEYDKSYNMEPVSLTMPLEKKRFEYNEFPSFFDGLLPEGYQLEALLKEKKIDRDDYISQLIAVGQDMVGAITIEKMNE